MFSEPQQAFSEHESDERFWSDLDSRVLSAAAKPGATLAAVSREAGGAFPTLVAERLAIYGKRLVLEGGADHVSPMPLGPELHAAEFEWYFTEECAIELADFLGPVCGGALVMGGPTVAAAMRRTGSTPTTVDRSAFLSERFGAEIPEPLRHDLRTPLGFLRSHRLVFFDAPWHEDHISRWLWQASHAVTRGGTIAFALFGELTRPAASVERAHLLEKASTIGKTTVLEDALRYDTPLFEAEALAAAGNPIRSPWRRGDLVLIKGVNASIAPPSVPVERPWRTVLADGRVVKLLPGQVFPSASGDESLRRLDTVSRSRVRELAIGAWTSRSEIAAIQLGNRKSTPSRATVRAS